jgi:hypothetical protein
MKHMSRPWAQRLNDLAAEEEPVYIVDPDLGLARPANEICGLKLLWQG